MSRVHEFDEVGRLPLPGDNVAIATRRLEAGTEIRCEGTSFRLDHTVMEGHRFAVRPIPAGQPLLSWELPFGQALGDIEPGTYVCNQGILEALGERDLDFELPAAPNFADRIEPYQLNEASFSPGRQVERGGEMPTFCGPERGPERGAGTRNYVVVLGTSSRTSGFARLLAARLQETVSGSGNVDGVVAVDHTEGGGSEAPNNQELVLRTLAGFAVHPNVGAVLAVDYGTEAVTNRMLQDYMAACGYPLGRVLHRFLSLKGSFAAHLEEGERQIRQWLETVERMRRCEQPVSRLKIALQCGGSDAFSGVSGNPLVGWVARKVLRGGGSVNLAETDELIGAEPYVLQNVRDADTAQKFLGMIEKFKERAAWHGESAEGNPSGGNKLRGLYNIALKSIGAAMKRHPEARLDFCIDYAEPMTEPGFYFMDSPGNDPESIAGQVASGCNMIYFVTGNGAVTNFPFVPTLKITTTTRQYELLSGDMDVNAGAYQDGIPMDELGRNMFALTLKVAGGTRSKGEKAGHYQVQIWRNWAQKDSRRLEEIRRRKVPDGESLPVRGEEGPDLRFTARRGSGYAIDQLALVLPTSLCSAQVARMAAERLNARGLGRAQGISRFVALVHTEGCGMAGAASERLYARAILGYLTHPLVRCALLLEHGCEKTHNDYMRHRLAELDIDPEEFGWASVQLDGGVEKTLDRVEAWFRKKLDTLQTPAFEPVGLEGLRLGLLNAGPVGQEAARCLARLTRWVVGSGGTVVVPENAGLLRTPDYVEEVLNGRDLEATLAYGQGVATPGFYVMETPTDHWVETLTGLGATGVQILLAHAGEHPVQGHPLVPLVQISAEEEMRADYGEDLDLVLSEPAGPWPEQVLELLGQVASRQRVPRAGAQGNTDFQLTRGLLGISM